MDNTVQISIIIPVYNVELYLKECIQSIQAQNIENIEIICVEDCSSDDSLEVLKECAANDSRIKILKNETNGGLSYARNRGMCAATGKYLMFVDSDDLLTENALQELYQFAEETGVNGIVYDMQTVVEGSMARERSENIVFQEEDDIEEKIYSCRELMVAFAKTKGWKIAAWRYFWRREVLEEKKMRFYPGLIHEDALFSFFVWMEIDKLAYRKKNYYIYRKRDNSIMHSMNYRYVESLFIIFNEIYHYWKANEFDEKINEAIRAYLDYIYGQLQSKKKYFSEYQAMSMGNVADAYLFEKMWNAGQISRKYAFLNENKIKQLQAAEKVIVYGAGTVGGEAITLLTEKGIAISAVAVTNKKNNMQMIMGYPIFEIHELKAWNKNSLVLLGVVERYQESIRETLAQLGFENIIAFDAKE